MRRKLLILFAAILMPLSAFCISADEAVKQKINLIKTTGNKKLQRDVVDNHVESCYYCMFSAVHTSVASDLGEIEVTVTNCMTGEVWYDTFDSSFVSQHQLVISSSSGLYEVCYVTDSGDLYEGTFIIE